jgi:ketosteroid isomerase-like protein
MFTKAEEAAIQETILALEKTALDRWGKGDPGGCLELYAPDITYFDPAVPQRVDGYEAMRQYYAPITGKISIDRFEYLNTDVRVNGDIAILTYNLVSHGRGAEDAPAVGTRWNVTAVYQHLSGDWKIVHSHFSYTQRP